jgi:hypothetical protein
MVRGHENRGPDVFAFVFFGWEVVRDNKEFQGSDVGREEGDRRLFPGGRYIPPVTLCSVFYKVPLVLLYSELCPSLCAGSAVNSVRQGPCREPNCCNHWPVWRVRSSVDEEPRCLVDSAAATGVRFAPTYLARCYLSWELVSLRVAVLGRHEAALQNAICQA